MTHDIEQIIDAESRRQQQEVRAYLTSIGRLDLLAEYNRNMRDIANGTMGARSCWQSISTKQRFVMRLLAEGRYLVRMVNRPLHYDAFGSARARLRVCELRTARALCAHGLIHVNGGALDPEAQFVITERGQFVCKHGPKEGD